MPATDILGKIGETVGTEFSNLKVSLGNIYATQSALSTLQATVSTNSSSISSNATGISNNASAISTNAGNISSNTSAIQSNDSDITALQTKTSALATNGTSANFSGNVSAQDLTVSGNLTVNGTTTTLNTQTVEIEDNIIEVNLAPTTGNETAQTGGLQVNRGSGNDKAQVIWDDTNDLFSLKKGTSDAKLNVGDVDAEKVIVPNGSAILINSVSLGNYASFETEFNANK